LSEIQLKDLYRWCTIPVAALEQHPERKVSFLLVADSKQMGELMAREFVDEIKAAWEEGRDCRAIVPCGPKSWYEPFVRLVNEARVSLKHLTVFHMDECLDWEGKLLHPNDPHNFRTFMERHFYGGIPEELEVPLERRIFPEPARLEEIKARIAEAPIDLTLGGFGQDGHVAYNQTRRHPFSRITLEQMRGSELRVQENNLDTIIALGQRSFGAAYQFVPPMSITLGMKECLSARKIRLYSDTGTWKQTALRVALFAEETVEYPMTLLQSHPDARITASYETARHPLLEHPEWGFKGIHA
jgi:glucosamine-6-phosphate deaminase